ncbi:creatininase family protein [Bacillus tianshenii]|nr:creatininase family protein [Bacillus tianshenii]
MEIYDLTDMTWEEVKDSLQTVKMAIVPVGAHEQHGPHMVESCDAVLAEEMSKRLGKRMFPHVLITPTINMGVSQHHINFPGTITLQPSTLLALIRDIITSLKHHGIEKFLFLNAHGGNQSTLNIASTTLSAELNVEIYYAKTTASAKQAIGTHIESTLFGHSCEREISEALYLAPQLIRKEKLTKGEINDNGRWKRLRPGNPIQGAYKYEEMTANGCIGNGTKGSELIGREIVEEAVENIASSLEHILELEVGSVHS